MPSKTEKQALVQVPPEESLGPAMRACNEGQRAFVIALITTGAQDNTKAARLAGYSDESEGSLRVTAHRLAHTPKVQAAIREQADQLLRSGAILGASVLLEIAADPLHKDRMKASIELLNRSGLIVQTEHKVIVENGTDENAIERVKKLATSLGLDPVALLGNIGIKDITPPKQIEDAVYEEVVNAKETIVNSSVEDDQWTV